MFGQLVVRVLMILVALGVLVVMVVEALLAQLAIGVLVALRTQVVAEALMYLVGTLVLLALMAHRFWWPGSPR